MSRAVKKMERITGVGIYTLAEAAGLAKTSSSTMRRWLKGYRFPTLLTKGESPPIFQPELPEIEGHVALNFLDLIEVLFIKAFRKHGVLMVNIRKAAQEAARRWNIGHPFCVKRLQTDGHSIFATLDAEEEDEGLLDLAKSQLCFKRVLVPYMRQMDYDVMGTVNRWWPLGKKKPVVLDPNYGFGRPIVFPGSIPTRAIYEAFQIEQSQREIAKWYEMPITSVRAAIEFEKMQAA